MAGLVSQIQVVGGHVPVYEAFYQQVDPAGTGHVAALDAAKFLKKSSLSDSILSKIWDLADPNGLGYLDKQSFFVALKLVALAQNSKDIIISNLSLDLPPPVMGDSTILLPAAGAIDWNMKPSERARYDKLFDSLGPVQGALPSTKVKPLMMNSKLPVDVLGRVWDLSDIDRDGSLDRDEFALAMHLIYKALDNHPVPTILPQELLPQSKLKKIPPGAVPVLPIIPVSDRPTLKQLPSPPLPSLLASLDLSSQNIQSKSTVKWIISTPDQTKYDLMFESADLDRDGFVNGTEIKDIFLQSGLPQPVLAHIWNLCDIKQNGRLNSEQFALAMHLVQQRVQGIEPPGTLSPDMMPPSFRPKSELEGALIENGSSVTGNSELDLISKDIEELTKEKQQLEHDITQKEADIRIKNGEIKLLSGELTTLTATLKQLENQKGEAQKRLDDLDSQKVDLDRNIEEIKKQLDEELEKVNTLKKHLNDQEVSLKSQEQEVFTKRKELNELKSEESKLEHNIQAGKSQFEALNKSLQDTLLNISQTKAKITQLQEYNRQLTDATALYDSAITSGDVSNISDSTFKLQPMFMDAEYSNLNTTNASSGSGFSVASSGFEDDPFKDKDPFADANGFTSDPFVSYDPFKEDPFKAANGGDLFEKPFANNDPFKDSDPFGGAFDLGKTDADPFRGDAFNNKPSSTFSNGDAFDTDPFGPPPVAPRTESPTPVLPPKKSKQPPPRPAPPKSSGPKTRAAPPAPSPDPFADSIGAKSSAHRGSLTGTNNQAADPFASAFGNDPFEPFGTTTIPSTDKDPFASGVNESDGFANFADFDSKFSPQPELSEEEQLAWAKKESVRFEMNRQKRAADREKADLELALALSKAEAAKRPT